MGGWDGPCPGSRTAPQTIHKTPRWIVGICAKGCGSTVALTQGKEWRLWKNTENLSLVCRECLASRAVRRALWPQPCSASPPLSWEVGEGTSFWDKQKKYKIMTMAILQHLGKEKWFGAYGHLSDIQFAAGTLFKLHVVTRVYHTLSQLMLTLGLWYEHLTVWLWQKPPCLFPLLIARIQSSAQGRQTTHLSVTVTSNLHKESFQMPCSWFPSLDYHRLIQTCLTRKEPMSHTYKKKNN